MASKKNSPSVKKKALEDVSIPVKKQRLVFPELRHLGKKEIPLESVPVPPSPEPVAQESEPFDLVTAEHGLFKRLNPFHLRTRKIFPVMHETVTVTEEPVEELPSFVSPLEEIPKEGSPFPWKTPVQEPLPFSSLPPDPWTKTRELLRKCQNALRAGKLDYAQIYYEELKPFYSKITPEQQQFVLSLISGIQQDIEMLKLHRIREQLRKEY